MVEFVKKSLEMPNNRRNPTFSEYSGVHRRSRRIQNRQEPENELILPIIPEVNRRNAAFEEELQDLFNNLPENITARPTHIPQIDAEINNDEPLDGDIAAKKFLLLQQGIHSIATMTYGTVFYSPTMENAPEVHYKIASYQFVVKTGQLNGHETFENLDIPLLSHELRQTALRNPHQNVALYDYLKIEDDPRLKRDVKFVLKRNPLIGENMFKMELEKMSHLLKNLHVRSKRQFQQFLFDQDADDFEDRCLETRVGYGEIRDEVVIDMAIAKVLKILPLPYKCTECIMGFKTIDDTISHIRGRHGNQYIDPIRHLNEVNRQRREAAEQVEERLMALIREKDQLIEQLRNENNARRSRRNRLSAPY